MSSQRKQKASIFLSRRSCSKKLKNENWSKVRKLRCNPITETKVRTVHLLKSSANLEFKRKKRKINDLFDDEAYEKEKGGQMMEEHIIIEQDHN